MRNDAARGSLLCALLGILLPIAAFVAARQLGRVTLVQATAATCGSLVLGLVALGLARRARRNLAYTLGRAGGRGTARVGKLLGVVAICIGCAAALALGSYALLRYFH
jgi:hypothetical protein